MGLSNFVDASRRSFREVMARRSFRAEDNPSFQFGGFFDLKSDHAELRSVVFCILIIFGGRHLDSWFMWISSLFGWEPPPLPPGKAEWHARVALVIGGIPLVLSILHFAAKLRLLFKSRHRRREMDARIEAEIAERLAEERQARREAGLPVEEPGPPTAEDRFRDTLRRWPILHDLVWGWPLLLALPLMALADHVSALTGIFLGAIAYVINHNGLAKRRGHLGRRLVLATLVGAIAVAVWFAYAPAITGGPVPDARIATPLQPGS